MSFISSLKSFMTLPGYLSTQPLAYPPGQLPGRLTDLVNGTGVTGNLKSLPEQDPAAMASAVERQAEAARSIRQATRSYV